MLTEGTSVIPEKQAGIEIFNCNDDFISVNSIRLCGEKLNDGRTVNDLTFNAPVWDTSMGPIVLPVRTNEEYVGRGFRLNYKQMPCNDAPSTANTEAPTNGGDAGGDSKDDENIGSQSKIYKNRFNAFRYRLT